MIINYLLRWLFPSYILFNKNMFKILTLIYRESIYKYGILKRKQLFYYAIERECYRGYYETI